MVEHGLRCSRRVIVQPPRHEDCEHAVAIRNRTLNNLTVVSHAWNNLDTPLVRVQFPDTALAAHADHLIASVQRVPYHVLPSFPEAPTMQIFIVCSSRATVRVAGNLCCKSSSGTLGACNISGVIFFHQFFAQPNE